MLNLLQLSLHVAAVLSASAQAPLSASTLPAYPWYNHSNTTESVLSLHKALVDIPSVSGNESHIAHWLSDYLESLDYHVYLQEVSLPEAAGTKSTKTYNLLASQDSSLKTPLLVTAHYDTVPPFTPFRRSKEHGKYVLHGRGSNDAKASLAAQVVALTDLIHTSKLGADKASLLFVADEEVVGAGMKAASHMNKDDHWKAVIFGEPTESRLVAGHKGITIFELVAEGRDAHSGYPWLGESAIDMMIPVLVALRQAESRLPRSDTLGNSTLNLGMIEAGVAANVVAAHAKVKASIRIGGGTFHEVQDLIEETVKETDPRVRVVWSSQGYGPITCDTDIEGFELSSVNYGTDVPNLTGNHKQYLWGPGSILSAHSDHEEIDEQELVDAVAAYQKLILGALENIEKEDRKDL